MDCINKPPRWGGDPASREVFGTIPEWFRILIKRPHVIGIGMTGVIATIRTSGKDYLAYQFSNRRSGLTVA
jgi:hypothetical protein